MLAALDFLVHAVVQLYIFILIATVIASWLIAFGVVNRHNQFVDAVLRTCYALTEPLLRPIRNILPNMGGIDISPIVVLIGLQLLVVLLDNTIFSPVHSGYVR